MNKPIPLHKWRWRGLPRVHIVVQHDNEPTQWIPLIDIAGWIAAAALLIASLILGVH